MSFYGIVFIVTILIISIYLNVFIGEVSNAMSIANAYSAISEMMIEAAGIVR
jgi:hypothetical protein